MASSIGTNIAADGNAEYTVVHHLLDFLERKYLAAPDKEKELAKKLLEELDGDAELLYHVVPGEFFDDIHDRLMGEEIPCMCARTENGDWMVLTSSNHEQEFLQIQEDVYSLSTSHARQCTAEEMIEIALRNKKEQIIQLSFGDDRWSKIAQQELYDNRIVCGMLNYGEDGMNAAPDIKAKIYVDHSSIVKASGKDLVGFSLRMAMLQSIKEFNKDAYELKIAQSEFDDRMVTEFAEAIKKGRTCVLGDAGELRNAPYLVCSGGEVVFHFQENGKHQEATLRIEPDATIDEIKATISRNAYGISDKVIYGNVQEWRNASEEVLSLKVKNERPTVETQRKAEVEKAKDKAMTKFANQIAAGENCVFGDASSLREDSFLEYRDKKVFFYEFDIAERKVMPPVEIDISHCKSTEEIRDTIISRTGFRGNTLHSDIQQWHNADLTELKEAIRPEKPRAIRPLQKKVRSEMETALEIVSKEASARTLLMIKNGLLDKDNSAAVYQAKKNIINELVGDIDHILESSNMSPSFLDHVIARDSATGHDTTAREWLNITVTHFMDDHEMAKDECTVDFETVDRKLAARVREEQMEADKVKNPEKESSKDKEKDKEEIDLD